MFQAVTALLIIYINWFYVDTRASQLSIALRVIDKNAFIIIQLACKASTSGSF